MKNLINENSMIQKQIWIFSNSIILIKRSWELDEDRKKKDKCCVPHTQLDP